MTQQGYTNWSLSVANNKLQASTPAGGSPHIPPLPPNNDPTEGLYAATAAALEDTGQSPAAAEITGSRPTASPVDQIPLMEPRSAPSTIADDYPLYSEPLLQELARLGGRNPIDAWFAFNG